MATTTAITTSRSSTAAPTGRIGMLREARPAVRRCWPARAERGPGACLRLVLDVRSLLAEEMWTAGGPAARLIEYRVPRETLRAHPPLVPAWRPICGGGGKCPPLVGRAKPFHRPPPSSAGCRDQQPIEEAALAPRLRDSFHRPAGPRRGPAESG